MNEEPQIERRPNEEGQARVARTASIHRPLARVVQAGMGIAKPPKTLGVGGIVVGFMLVIGIGTLLLSLPGARQPGTDWDPIVALFTATSAVCVTGLEVTNTGEYWSTFGHVVIAGLIQVGGIGVMTASLLILLLLRRSISLRDRFLVREASGIARIHSVAGLVLIITLSTIIIEVIGGIALWYQLYARYDAPNSVWLATFHTISSFNNAGFEIFQNGSSLSSFAGDAVFLFTTGILIVAGGLGMLLLLDMASKRKWGKFTFNTRIVLATSAILLVFGFLTIFFFEYTNPQTLGNMSVTEKATNAAFHSASRTAGFASIDVNKANEETQFIKIILMYIGGATGSTAGGIKVTTFAVLVLATFAAVRGYENATVFGRRISHRIVYRAGAVAGLYAVLIFLGAFVLIITEEFNFREILFEAVTASGTVGWTTGITSELSQAGRITLTVLMFVGRLGPLTLAYMLGQRAKEPLYEQPESEVAIG
ncbi:MAG: Trk family potassium uptake protein [Chloroflexi bacterium]|nr:Trk family potassium uptake protein [Chloroflexota bacterium]